MNHRAADINEYIRALKGSDTFGPQVVHHRKFDSRKAQLKEVDPQLPAPLHRALADFNITSLYSHQAEAIKCVRAGEDLLAATPTASGKSMIYNLPVLAERIENPEAKALYLFPLKALARDQLRVVNYYEPYIDQSGPQLAAVYDGDTSSYQRRKIRDNPPSIMITNPDMLHLSFLPYHERWSRFFRNLTHVVIDEVHTYRGIFGSHMAWVIRRLIRLAAHYGASPRFILLSATIGNPAELGKSLLGREVTLVEQSGAPVAEKDIVFFNPFESGGSAACKLLEAAIKRGLRTIVYTQSRKMTELITMWTRPRLGELADRLSSYRAGFLADERRDIESRLATGELLAVISTSALELGIDIGDLDLCLLVGYPGSIMASRQRGGRVGRGMQPSAVILIAQEDSLDQHFMRHPDDFFKRSVEAAVLNPENEIIMDQHLHCAAAELPLVIGEELLADGGVMQSIGRLSSRGVLLQGADGSQWFSTRKYPQRQVGLRGGSQQLTIINREDGVVIGEVGAGRALHECHPGAVYLHHSRMWLIEDLDLVGHEVVATHHKGSYYTRPLSEKETEILEVQAVREFYGCRVSFGRLKVRERVISFQKRNQGSNKLIATMVLDLPEQIFETEGLWIEIPKRIQEKLEKEMFHFMGAIHAMEHTMIGLIPLLVLCDRNDIGGISCPVHAQTSEAAVFIYDGHPGGVGLCREGYEKFDSLLRKSRETVHDCSCELGCPSCVHSPKCGSGNRPIDKAACLNLFDLILENGDSEGPQRDIIQSMPDIKHDSKADTVNEQFKLPKRYGVFDLETMRSAAEVGGWHRAAEMGMSIGVVYDGGQDRFAVYREDQAAQLIDHLERLDLVVGFNNIRFDNQVLSAYTAKSLHLLPNLDLLDLIKNRLGYRLSLDRLAQCTLEKEKSADGLQALQWYREGRMDLIIDYCRRDVAITRDLFLYGLKNGYLLFFNKAGKKVRLPLDLKQAVSQIVAKKSGQR
ncbi:MAG: DEAD/DEAH box helicase [Thermodesulfobacteriota bacterium]